MPDSRYTRYVALGDSQTEGLGDGDEESGPRGWADRLAEHLAGQLAPEGRGVLYANLAVRGRLAGQVRAEQLAPALALRPDLATVVAGVNDLLRPGFDADEVAGQLEAMFAALTAQGARVATVTFPDVTRMTPLARPIGHRVHILNDRIREAAGRHGVAVVETAPHPVVTDPRLWGPDRLHASPLGHARIAAAVAHALALPGSDDSWTLPLPPDPAPPSRLRAVGAELSWIGSFLGPWLVRRVRGRSSGDGRQAKRPALLPVELLADGCRDGARDGHGTDVRDKHRTNDRDGHGHGTDVRDGQGITDRDSHGADDQDGHRTDDQDSHRTDGRDSHRID